eukprot:1186088-Prorocentrum_minimum.AAC.1
MGANLRGASSVVAALRAARRRGRGLSVDHGCYGHQATRDISKGGEASLAPFSRRCPESGSQGRTPRGPAGGHPTVGSIHPTVDYPWWPACFIGGPRRLGAAATGREEGYGL